MAADLSPAEMDILCLALRGLSNAEIAEKRVTSVKAVESHIFRIFEKFGKEATVSHRMNAFLLLAGALNRYGLAILPADNPVRRSVEALNWITA